MRFQSKCWNRDSTYCNEKNGAPYHTEPPLTEWREFLSKLKNPKHSIKVGLVGKYVELPDAYKSIAESFIHSGARNECSVNVEYIHSEDITERNVAEKLRWTEWYSCCTRFWIKRYRRKNPDSKICKGK